MSEMRITASQPVAALMDYLGVPVEVIIKNGTAQYKYPALQPTCAGQLDLDAILKRFHEGEQEISDAKAFAGSVFKVIARAREARKTVQS
jgi:hypothetical protein